MGSNYTIHNMINITEISYLLYKLKVINRDIDIKTRMKIYSLYSFR